MRLSQGRVELELHQLSSGSGPAVLLLHALYGSSADWAEGFGPWPGPVFGLDLAGHGASSWVRGGAYTPEILAVGVDAALDHIGAAAVVGSGVGAYVGLLVAGARRERVSAALLLPGAGLAGGGAVPDFEREAHAVGDLGGQPAGCDPLVGFLDRDVRPVDYCQVFARKASRLLLFEDGTPRPPWWEAVRALDGVAVVGDVGDALAQLAAPTSRA